MAKNKSDKTITIDGNEYNIAELSDNARSQIANIQFVDTQIQQLKNELAVTDTARMAYSAALKDDLTLVNNKG